MGEHADFDIKALQETENVYQWIDDQCKTYMLNSENISLDAAFSNIATFVNVKTQEVQQRISDAEDQISRAIPEFVCSSQYLVEELSQCNGRLGNMKSQLVEASTDPSCSRIVELDKLLEFVALTSDISTKMIQFDKMLDKVEAFISSDQCTSATQSLVEVLSAPEYSTILTKSTTRSTRLNDLKSRIMEHSAQGLAALLTSPPATGVSLSWGSDIRGIVNSLVTLGGQQVAIRTIRNSLCNIVDQHWQSNDIIPSITRVLADFNVILPVVNTLELVLLSSNTNHAASSNQVDISTTVSTDSLNLVAPAYEKLIERVSSAIQEFANTVVEIEIGNSVISISTITKTFEIANQAAKALASSTGIRIPSNTSLVPFQTLMKFAQAETQRLRTLLANSIPVPEPGMTPTKLANDLEAQINKNFSKVTTRLATLAESRFPHPALWHKLLTIEIDQMFVHFLTQKEWTVIAEWLQNSAKFAGAGAANQTHELVHAACKFRSIYQLVYTKILDVSNLMKAWIYSCISVPSELSKSLDIFDVKQYMQRHSHAAAWGGNANEIWTKVNSIFSDIQSSSNGEMYEGSGDATGDGVHVLFMSLSKAQEVGKSFSSVVATCASHRTIALISQLFRESFAISPNPWANGLSARPSIIDASNSLLLIPQALSEEQLRSGFVTEALQCTANDAVIAAVSGVKSRDQLNTVTQLQLAIDMLFLWRMLSTSLISVDEPAVVSALSVLVHSLLKKRNFDANLEAELAVLMRGLPPVSNQQIESMYALLASKIQM